MRTAANCPDNGRRCSFGSRWLRVGRKENEMAKRSRKRAKAKGPKRYVSHPKYAGKQYDCYGRHVRSGKGKRKSPRVYCGAQKPA